MFLHIVEVIALDPLALLVTAAFLDRDTESDARVCRWPPLPVLTSLQCASELRVAGEAQKPCHHIVVIGRRKSASILPHESQLNLF